jgi:OOP family OmpA-OmpF porin
VVSYQYITSSKHYFFSGSAFRSSHLKVAMVLLAPMLPTCSCVLLKAHLTKIYNMKLHLKKSALLISGLLAGSALFAQTTDTTRATNDYVKPFSGNSFYRTWSIGISAGVLTPNTPFGSNEKQDFTSPDGNFGYGAYIKNQITPAFGIRADFLAGKLSGSGSQLNSAGVAPINSYSTKIHYSAALSGNVTLGNISWHDDKSAIQPYFTAGAGTMNYTPVVTNADGSVVNFKTDGNGSINELFVPVGLGLKFDIAPGVNLDLGYQVNFVFSDNVDGYKYGSNNDKFAYAHAGLEFALGSKKPQLATHNPVSSMRQEYLWENQNTKTLLEAQIDAQNAKIAAEKAENDRLRNDLNTTNANLARFTMDSDGDGVPDFLDKCPNTPTGTKVDGSGCPLVIKNTTVYITEQDKQVVKEAVKNLEFDFAKATIRDHSYASLDRLAQLLQEKNFNLKLAGYTDNVGSVAANLKLSSARANAVKTYLIGKGVSEAHIQAEGYGKANPIASNKTEKGRQINRRVEFTLF